ncbi:MAG: HDOD domain-containing protein [Myxococcota bacterium]
MTLVHIDDLMPGMVLVSALKDSGGRMLLPAGAELELGQVKTLKARGVTTLDVAFPEDLDGEGVGGGPAKAREPVLSDEVIEQSQRYLGAYFEPKMVVHPLGDALFRHATLHFAKRLASGRTLPASPFELVTSVPAAPAHVLGAAPKNASTLFAKKVQLASLPDVYHQIVEVMQNPRSSASDVAAMVSKDTTLSSRLLKLVNSAYFGLPARVDSIARAITLIGTNELSTLALGVSVISTFRSVPAGLISMKGFWRHSIACGIFARLLAASRGGLPDETYFVGGLLHDVGRMVLLQLIPEAYGEVIRRARTERKSLYDSERELLGYDHSEVGTLLCREWRLSSTLETMVGQHHAPVVGGHKPECSILHVADLLAKVHLLGENDGGCVMLPGIDDGAWRSLQMEPATVVGLFGHAHDQIDAVTRLFLSDGE